MKSTDEIPSGGQNTGSRFAGLRPSGTRELAYRIWLRIFGGREYWHYRKFPHGTHIDCDHRRVWISRGGNCLRAEWYSALRNTQRGRCNIVLSGPSVAGIHQPKLLGRHYSIWANGSPVLALAEKIRPSLYIVADTGFLRRRLSDYMQYAGAAQSCLISFAGAAELVRRVSPVGRFHVFDDPASPWHRVRYEVTQSGEACFSADANTNSIRVGLSVAISCLRAAMDLGFSEIDIYGLDLNASGRFYRERSAEPSWLDLHYENIRQELMEASVYARQCGIRITNCSQCSRLDEAVFPRRDPNAVLDGL